MYTTIPCKTRDAELREFALVQANHPDKMPEEIVRDAEILYQWLKQKPGV